MDKLPFYKAVRICAYVDAVITTLRIGYLCVLMFTSITTSWLNGPLGLADQNVLKFVFAATIGAASLVFTIISIPYQVQVTITATLATVLTGSSPEFRDDGVLKQSLLVAIFISQVVCSLKLWAAIVFLMDCKPESKPSDIQTRIKFWRGVAILFILADSLPSLVVLPGKFLIEIGFQGYHVYVLSRYLLDFNTLIDSQLTCKPSICQCEPSIENDKVAKVKDVSVIV